MLGRSGILILPPFAGRVGNASPPGRGLFKGRDLFPKGPANGSRILGRSGILILISFTGRVGNASLPGRGLFKGRDLFPKGPANGLRILGRSGILILPAFAGRVGNASLTSITNRHHTLVAKCVASDQTDRPARLALDFHECKPMSIGNPPHCGSDGQSSRAARRLRVASRCSASNF
jgi:hypothetical protein